MSADSKKYSPVPGQGKRWYDYCIRAIGKTSIVWRGKHTPKSLSRWINRRLNDLHFYHELDSLRFDSNRLDSMLSIRDGEEVILPAIWAIELCTPCHIDKLQKRFRFKKWEPEDAYVSWNEGFFERAVEGRSTDGFSWQRLVTVVDRDLDAFFVSNGVREKLPAFFDYVSIDGSQIGSSITALSFCFVLSDYGKKYINEILHIDLPPATLKKKGYRSRAYGSKWAKLIALQKRRSAIHDEARNWIRKNCPGYFSNRCSYPICDMSLFKHIDPSYADLARGDRELLRGIGVSLEPYYYVSPSMPGLCLGEVDNSFDGATLRKCWGIVGNIESVFASYRENPTEVFLCRETVEDLIHSASEPIRDFLIMEAVIAYARQQQSLYFEYRDKASKAFSHHNNRSARKLRDVTLTSSLDLHEVNRDSAYIWGKQWRRFCGHSFSLVYSDAAPNRGLETDAVELLKQERDSAFDTLMKEDKAFREILGIVSSIGFSDSSEKLAKRALLIAVLSLIVACLAVVSEKLV